MYCFPYFFVCSCGTISALYVEICILSHQLLFPLLYVGKHCTVLQLSIVVKKYFLTGNADQYYTAKIGITAQKKSYTQQHIKQHMIQNKPRKTKLNASSIYDS